MTKVRNNRGEWIDPTYQNHVKEHDEIGQREFKSRSKTTAFVMFCVMAMLTYVMLFILEAVGVYSGYFNATISCIFSFFFGVILAK